MKEGPPQIDARYGSEGTKVVQGMYNIMNDCYRMIPSQRIPMAQVVADLEKLLEVVRK